MNVASVRESRLSGAKMAARVGLQALASSIALLMALGSAHAQGAGQTAPSEPKALGLIVKLKDAQAQSVVRLKASVRPSDSAQSQRLRLAALGARKRVGFVAQKPTAFGAQLIHAGRFTTVDEAEAEAARLRLDPDVEWVVVNRMEKPAAVGQTVTPNGGSQFANHYWLATRTGSTPGVGNFQAAWTRLIGQTVTPVVVAVLDTGILSHPDIDGRLLPGYDFVSESNVSNDGNGLDPDPTDPGNYARNGADCDAHDSTWHGTTVTSMLTAPRTSSQFGPGVLASIDEQRVLPVRVGGACGALVSDIIEGMLWAAGVDYQGSPSRNPNPARVLNLSFGGSGTCRTNTGGDVLYREAIAALETKGALVVSSAGNGDNVGSDGYTTPTRPANCPGVVAVTALRVDGLKASYANLVNGHPNDVGVGYYGIAVAGGDNFESMYLLGNSGTTTALPFFLDGRDYLDPAAGTSFAAPQVAGVAALIMAVAPQLTVAQVRQMLLDSATTHASPAGTTCSNVATGVCVCTETTCGKGVLNADEAVRLAALATPGSAFVAPDVRSSFVPDRLKTSNGKGGGGAADWPMLVLLTLGIAVAAWQRRQALRVQRIKSGTR